MDESIIKTINSLLKNLDFGELTIVVMNGAIVRIETSTKVKTYSKIKA